MEPYDLKLHQVTFKEEHLQEENLDSFSNVIAYDSPLLDSTTGKKPNTEQVSQSLRLACQHANSFAQNTSQNVLHSSFLSDVVSTHLPTSLSFDTRLLQSISSSTPSPVAKRVVPRKESSKTDYKGTITKLIKDLYSDVDIPFTPLEENKCVPEWIFLHKTLEQDYSVRKRPDHIFAQPSEVKVTQVYNQSVWSEIPSTPAQVTHLLTHSDSLQIPESVVADFDIKTLLQVSANTSASKKYERGKYLHSSSIMARRQSEDEKLVNKDEPFGSLASALHLQQSVISNPNIAPVAPDVVAKIVEEAERKLRLGGASPNPVTAGMSTGVQNLHKTTVGQTGTTHLLSVTNTFSLPPPPTMPNIDVTKQLIGSTMHGHTSQHHSFHDSMKTTGDVNYRPEIDNLVEDSSLNARSSAVHIGTVQDDNQSVASTNSELESFSENATESFLKSLPPFKPLKLEDIMPLHRPRPDMRFSPPVKETSFRPLELTEQKTPPGNTSSLQSFVTDSGVFSPDNQSFTSPGLTSTSAVNKTNVVIPKPGPLFQVRPSLVRDHERIPKSTHTVTSLNTDSVQQNEKVDEILREKAKLEGQLEMLTIESQATLQERAELQAQVASLKLKLMSQKVNRNDPEKDLMKSDLDVMRKLRESLEQSVGDLQKQLEETSEEGRNIQEELNQSQDACDKLNLKMKEIKDEMRSKEMTIQALKNKVAELYVEVQVSLQTKLEADNECRAAKSDLSSLKSSKDWYQGQLEIATRARSELQREMTILQAQALSQSSIIERLKNENTKLRHQFTEIQNKALKEKELLAKHLETINSDMMDREAAFQEIQRERSYLEKSFDSKIQTAEDEKNRITLLIQMTSDLESQLDKTHADLKKKQNQITKIENENIELMKKLSLSQEVVIEKDGVIEELRINLLEVEEKLKAFQSSVLSKDSEIMKLKEDKAAVEIALKSALMEKDSVDQVLDGLKCDMGKVETSFKLMRQELNSKDQEVGVMKSRKQTSEEELVQLRKELENEKRNTDHTKQEIENKAQQLSAIQNQKIKLESDLVIYTEKITALEYAHETAIKEKEFLDAELNATRDKLEALKEKLEIQIQNESVQKAAAIDEESFGKVSQECNELKQRIAQLEKDSKKDGLKQKAKNVKLNQDLSNVKDELIERQKTFDENIEILSVKLRELAAEKEKVETELTMVHRKYEFSMLEQKDQIDAELQKLATELQNVRFEKQDVEAKFIELQHARESDLSQYQQQILAIESELQTALQMQSEKSVVAENNQQLLIELEKEKGRLEGLKQSNATLKEHVMQLEDALAGRESMLIEMRASLEQVVREKEAENHETIKRVQTLEESLQKEKTGQRDIKKQIGLKITENKKLKRQTEGLKTEQEQSRLDLEQRVHEVDVLNAELETQKQNILSQTSLSQTVENENKALQRELERLQEKLQDNEARDPVIQEHIKSLEWQIKSKTTELETMQHQIELTEQRQQSEMENIKQLLKEKNQEIESLKSEVVLGKQDKHHHQSKLVELRSALKASIQHHKMSQKLTSLSGVSNSGDTELPPLPFDIEDMEKLLQDTTVKALESKPLDNLQNCLLNLRSEIAGLQHQMDVHTNTLETSTDTWNSLEDQVKQIRHVVQTIANTTMSTATTTSLAAAAVDISKTREVIDI